MSTELRFRFSLEKFINALSYFASKGIGDLTKLKAVKLLYLADQYHLHRYGRPITGDRYIAMDLGPVPESAFQLIGRIIDPAEVDDPVRARALQQLEVRKGFRYTYPVIRTRQQPDLDVFSDSEIEALDATLKQFGKEPARSLVDMTHEHAAYRRADAGRAPGSSIELPYDYFFDDAPASVRDLREVASQDQEDRDFADAFQRAGRAALAEKRRTSTPR
jgi:uncharacterized phage-associated protein